MLNKNDTKIKEEKSNLGLSEGSIIKITTYGEVVIFSTQMNSLVLGNCRIYRDAFANIVTDGIFKVVFDTSNIRRIDGAGLALLISVNQALKKYGGELALIYPNKEINNRFSYLQLNDIFRSYSSYEEAIKILANEVILNKPITDEYLNICLSCTYINVEDARYCGFCGTNLMVGRGKNIIDYLKKQISGKITSENTNDLRNNSSQREIVFMENQIPSEFFVEIFNDNLKLSYESKHTFRNEFIEKK
jgi:anti-anti-sigma regulatory factor